MDDNTPRLACFGAVYVDKKLEDWASLVLVYGIGEAVRESVLNLYGELTKLSEWGVISPLFECGEALISWKLALHNIDEEQILHQREWVHSHFGRIDESLPINERPADIGIVVTAEEVSTMNYHLCEVAARCQRLFVVNGCGMIQSVKQPGPGRTPLPPRLYQASTPITGWGHEKSLRILLTLYFFRGEIGVDWADYGKIFGKPGVFAVQRFRGIESLRREALALKREHNPASVVLMLARTESMEIELEIYNQYSETISEIVDSGADVAVADYIDVFRLSESDQLEAWFVYHVRASSKELCRSRRQRT